MHRSLSGTATIACAAAIALLSACSQPTIPRPSSAPHIASLQNTDLTPLVRGRVLIGELGCTACHADPSAHIEHRVGPDLATAADRLLPSYFAKFLTSPKSLDPETAMPDLLRHLDGEVLLQTASELASYLRSFQTSAPKTTAIDTEAAARGGQLYKSIGCRACHLQDDSLRLRKYSVTSLQNFLLAPHKARPARRMPDMALTPAEAFDLANYWLSTRGDGTQTEATDATKVSAGRGHFAKLGCANCHSLPDNERAPSSLARPLKELDAAKGCLSGDVGPWPHYGLSSEQTADIQTALANLSDPLAKEERIQQLLASRNCFACHDRGDIKTDASQQDLFLTHDASIGQEGRVPPSLTGVGAKLQASWLTNAIAHGQSERPYLQTRMPGFGKSYADALTTCLTATDTLPPVTIKAPPKDRKAAEKVKNLGRELVGHKGMNCITCHLFAGEKAGAVGGIDLVHSTGKRLRPEWFSHFLREPFRFNPNTLMPKFFPDGKSTRPEIAEGDIDKQIDAMWHYLSKGRNIGKPSGINRPPMELMVKDHAVMLRRSVQNTGKRGISVGYPKGVNITFDAENIGLNQIWWGRFIDARPVWSGQGSGQAHILSRKKATLPNGPAFAVLSNANDAWPVETRRDRGDQFLGYELDEQQRPTFLYTFGKTKVTDTPREIEVDGKTTLRRLITLTGENGACFFRVASHKDIAQLDAHTVRVGKSLRIHAQDAKLVIVTGDEEKDVRLSIPIESEGKAIQIDYTWMEEGK